MKFSKKDIFIFMTISAKLHLWNCLNIVHLKQSTYVHKTKNIIIANVSHKAVRIPCQVSINLNAHVLNLHLIIHIHCLDIPYDLVTDEKILFCNNSLTIDLDIINSTSRRPHTTHMKFTLQEEDAAICKWKDFQYIHGK